MTVWVIGGHSFLGGHLIEKFQEQGIDCLTPSRNGDAANFSVDLLDWESCRKLPITNLDVVIVLAGVSAPEDCENDFDAAYKVNVVGTKRFISFVLGKGARVLFASSDTVYGEQSRVVDESAPCEPVGKYAIMKRDVEQAFKDHINFVSFRLSYIESGNDKFSNFLKDASANQIEVDVFSDLVRNTVSIENVVEGLHVICTDWDRLDGHRIINFSGPVSESRAALASRIIRRLGLDLRIKPVPAPGGFFASRPRIIKLDNGRFSKLLASKS
jgi:dTDP-4-dehydrorhamnose reductase